MESKYHSRGRSKMGGDLVKGVSGTEQFDAVGVDDTAFDNVRDKTQKPKAIDKGPAPSEDRPGKFRFR